MSTEPRTPSAIDQIAEDWVDTLVAFFEARN